MRCWLQCQFLSGGLHRRDPQMVKVGWVMEGGFICLAIINESCLDLILWVVSSYAAVTSILSPQNITIYTLELATEEHFLMLIEEHGQRMARNNHYLARTSSDHYKITSTTRLQAMKKNKMTDQKILLVIGGDKDWKWFVGQAESVDSRLAIIIKGLNHSLIRSKPSLLSISKRFIDGSSYSSTHGRMDEIKRTT